MSIDLGIPTNFGKAMRSAVRVLEYEMPDWRDRCVDEQEAVRRLYEAQEKVRVNDDCPPPPPEYERFDEYDAIDEELFYAVVLMFDGVEPPISYGPLL